MHKIFLIAICLAAQSNGTQQDAALLFLKKIHNMALTQSKGYEWLCQLTKEAGSRIAGSEAYYVFSAVNRRELELSDTALTSVAYLIDKSGK